jgi:urease accessory protein UreE
MSRATRDAIELVWRRDVLFRRTLSTQRDAEFFVKLDRSPPLLQSGDMSMSLDFVHLAL